MDTNRHRVRRAEPGRNRDVKLLRFGIAAGQLLTHGIPDFRHVIESMAVRANERFEVGFRHAVSTQDFLPVFLKLLGCRAGLRATQVDVDGNEGIPGNTVGQRSRVAGACRDYQQESKPAHGRTVTVVVARFKFGWTGAGA